VKLCVCQRKVSAVVLALFLMAIIGCGGTYHSTVSGEVSLDGAKLTLGTVAFHPVGGGPASYAAITGAGTYAMQTGREQGLKTGEYVVTVVANERPTELRSKDGGPPAPGKRLTPPWYGAKLTSGLRYTIERGRNTINLELTSQAPPGWKPGRKS